MDTASRVRDLVAPSVEAAGVELYDVELVGSVLRITLDRAGGVDMGVIASVTRAISRQLDETDPVPGEYTLEVSSPGLERPLRTPDHFARAVGDTVTVKTRSGVTGDRRVKGTLVAADDRGFTIRPTDAAEDRTLAYGDVERVRTVFDWGPAPKPGKAPKAGTAPRPGTAPEAAEKPPTPEKSSPEKKAATS